MLVTMKCRQPYNVMPPPVAGQRGGLPRLALQWNPTNRLFTESLLTGWRRLARNGDGVNSRS